MRLLVAAATILMVLAGCAQTFGTLDTGDTYATYRSPSKHVAQPWLFGEPKYPKSELAQGVSGEVVVDARVSAGGELQDVRIGPGAASSPAFADAVRDAIPLWRFYPPLDANCQPTDERILVRMSFRVENGKPHIVVSGEGPQWSGDGQPQPISTRQAAYPRKTSYFRWDEGVTVFARATIDAQGNVVGTNTKAYPRGLPWMMMSFEDQARIALLDFKFPASGSAAPRYYCTDMIFAASK
jgi:TonB family protein